MDEYQTQEMLNQNAALQSSEDAIKKNGVR